MGSTKPQPHGPATRPARTDCFGYCKRQNRCDVLTDTWCKYEECKFYKPKGAVK